MNSSENKIATAPGSQPTQPGETPPRQGALGGGSLLSKLLKFGVPLLISVGLCFALFRDVDLPEMWRIIREECDFRYIGLSILIGFIPLIVRAARWGIQLKAIGVRPPLHILFYSILGTYAFNVLFPRLGEVWRSGYIAYRQDAPFSEIFGSMIADRLADTLTVLLLLLITIGFAAEPFQKFFATYPDFYNKMSALLSSPLFWGAGVACLLLFIALLRYGRGKFIGRVRSFFSGIWEGFAAIARMKGKGRWLLLTAVLWTAYFMQMYVSFQAFPLTRSLYESNGIIVVLICYMLTTLSMAIPSNGGIGPYQMAVNFGLTLFAPAAVTASVHSATHTAFITEATAFGNTVIASQTLMFIVGGIVVFILIAIDRHNRVPAVKYRKNQAK